MTDTPDQRLTRWAERDAVVGLDAELRQVRAALAEREAEVAALRQRNAELADRVTQASTERDVYRRRLGTIDRPSLLRRLYRRVRSIAGSVLSH